MQDPAESKIQLEKRTVQSKNKLFGELPKLDFEFNVNDNVVKECDTFFSESLKNTNAPSINFIVGLNGFGKTTHAMYYYKTYQDKYNTICWITPSTFTQVLQNLTEYFQIKNLNQEGRENSVEILYKKLLKYLSDEPSWLLIFDGFDDPSFDFNLIIPSNEMISSSRHVLVTSRRADWKTNFNQKIYPLRNWNVGNAVSFTLQKFQTHNITANIDDIVMLCESIMGLYPLGITIVINYIIEGKGKYPLKEIIKALITPDTNIYTEILRRVDGEGISPKSILIGYINELKQELSPSDFELAIHYIQLLAFLDFSSPIPPILLQRWYSIPQKTPSSPSLGSPDSKSEKHNLTFKSKQDSLEKITNSVLSVFKKLCFIYESNEHIAPYFSAKKTEEMENKEVVYYSPLSSVLKFFTNSRAFTDLFKDYENDYIRIILKINSFLRNQLDYNVDRPSETPYYLMLLPHLHMCQQHLQRSSETKIKGVTQKNIQILTDRFYCLLKLGTYYGHELRLLHKGLSYLEEAERLTFQLSLPVKACANLNSLLSALYMETNDLALAKIKSEAIKVNILPEKCSEVDVHLSFQRARNYQILGLHNECSKEIEIGLSIAENLKSDSRSKSHHEVMLYSLLGRNKMLLGDYKEADFLIQESTELRKDLRSKESLHPYTCSQHLVSIPLYMYTGNYALADKLLVIMEEYVNKLGGKCDPAIKYSVLRFRGLLHRKQGNYQESYTLLELAKNYHDEVYHNKPFIYYYKILMELLKTNLLTNLLTPDLRNSYLAQITSQIDQQYPQEHPDKATLLIIKGDLEINYSSGQEYTGNLDKAISYYQAALAMQRKVFGYTDIHPTFINIHLKLASAFIQKHDTTLVNNHLEAADKAIKLFARKNNIECHILSMDYLLIKSKVDNELQKFKDEHLNAIHDKLTKWNIYASAHNISAKQVTLVQLNKFVNNFNKFPVVNFGQFDEKASSIIKIQSLLRGHLVRKSVERRFNELFLAAGISRYGKAIVNQLFSYQESRQYLKGLFLLEKLKGHSNTNFRSNLFPENYLNDQILIEEQIIQCTPFKPFTQLPNKNEKFIEGLVWLDSDVSPNNFFSHVGEIIRQDPVDLRIKVINHIRENRQQYSEFIPNNISDQSLSSYCDTILQDPECFDGLILEALIRFIKRPILVISPRKKIVNIKDIDRFNESNPVFIYYYFINGHNHFNALQFQHEHYPVANIIKSLSDKTPVNSILKLFNQSVSNISGERLKTESPNLSEITAINIISRQGLFSESKQLETYWCIDTTNMTIELNQEKLLEYLSKGSGKRPQIHINVFEQINAAEEYLKSIFKEKLNQKGSHRIRGFIIKCKISVDSLSEACSKEQYTFIIDNVISVMKYFKDPHEVIKLQDVDVWKEHQYILPVNTSIEEKESVQRTVSHLSEHSQNKELFPQHTAGHGDCAFHAIFGKWNGKEFVCDDVVKKRKEIANEIRSCNTDAILYNLVKAAIKALIIENKNTDGLIIKEAQAQYQAYARSDQARMQSAWDKFSLVLNKYQNVIEFIQNFCKEYFAKKSISLQGLTLNSRFQTCLNESGEELKSMILSIPELDNAFIQYNDECSAGYNWEPIYTNSAVINEYATFIEKLGNWLIPIELQIIGHIFNLSINYYIKNPNSRNHAPLKIDTYNPGKSQTVSLCFNGVNHYERMASSEQLMTTYFHNLKAQSQSDVILITTQLNEPSQEKRLTPSQTLSQMGIMKLKNYQFVETNSGLTFDRHQVAGDGECGYSAFGITRKDAYDLIKNRLNEVRDLLLPVVKEAVLSEKFITYLKEKGITNAALLTEYNKYKAAAEQGGNMDISIIDNLYQKIDLTVIQGYIDYDIRDLKVDAGWSHPRILQVLAYLQKIKLYMWQLHDGKLIPHRQEEYAVYTPPTVESRTDLLFINNNHFDRLELQINLATEIEGKNMTTLRP